MSRLQEARGLGVNKVEQKLTGAANRLVSELMSEEDQHIAMKSKTISYLVAPTIRREKNSKVPNAIPPFDNTLDCLKMNYFLVRLINYNIIAWIYCCRLALS